MSQKKKMRTTHSQNLGLISSNTRSKTKTHSKGIGDNTVGSLCSNINNEKLEHGNCNKLNSNSIGSNSSDGGGGDNSNIDGSNDCHNNNVSNGGRDNISSSNNSNINSSNGSGRSNCKINVSSGGNSNISNDGNCIVNNDSNSDNVNINNRDINYDNNQQLNNLNNSEQLDIVNYNELLYNEDDFEWINEPMVNEELFDREKFFEENSSIYSNSFSSNISTNISTPSYSSVSTESTNESNSQIQKKNIYQPVLRIKNNTSWTNKYFEKKNNGKSCKKCNRSYSLTTSTSNLASHLREVHGISKNNFKINNKSIESQSGNQQRQTNLHECLETIQALPRNLQNDINNHLTKWIVNEMLPFSVISSKNFKELCYKLNKRYQVPSILTLKTNILDNVEHTKDQLKLLLKKSSISVNFTMDTWTQFHTPFICITIHWLDQDFKMYQALLSIESFSYPHTGINIASKLNEVFSKWDLHKKILAGVTDNASNMALAMSMLENVVHIKCGAHTIQLAVKKGLECIEETLLDRALGLNKWLLNHDKHRERLHIMQKNILQQEFNDPLLLPDENSNLESEPDTDLEFNDNSLNMVIQNNNNSISNKHTQVLNPVKSVVTRWNSIFFVLERLLKLRESVELLIKNLSNDPNRDYKNDGISLDSLFLTNNEWVAVEELVNILKPFADATKILSGSNYPTLNIVNPIINNLNKKLREFQEKIDDLEIGKVIYVMLEQINYRWRDPGMTALVATFLDPRFRDLNFLNLVERKEVHKYVHNLILKCLENNNQCDLNDMEVGSVKSALSSFFEDNSARGKYFFLILNN